MPTSGGDRADCPPGTYGSQAPKLLGPNAARLSPRQLDISTTLRRPSEKVGNFAVKGRRNRIQMKTPGKNQAFNSRFVAKPVKSSGPLSRWIPLRRLPRLSGTSQFARKRTALAAYCLYL